MIAETMTLFVGLDIGGANLKAASPDQQAVCRPFPLWKQPDQLATNLARLLERFPDADALAVTMTGELCDCYADKREGVNAILDAVEQVANGRTVGVWTTDGRFLTPEQSRANPLSVAAANWHALASWASRFLPNRTGLLIDIGSTTTDLIPIVDGMPIPRGRTDFDRLKTGELVYLGVKRTPVYALASEPVAAELFATTDDIFLILHRCGDRPNDTDTADGRPATRPFALARLARMLGGDLTTHGEPELAAMADRLHHRFLQRIVNAAEQVWQAAYPGKPPAALISGSGEFIAREVAERLGAAHLSSLSDQVGNALSEVAPAYALAVLAAESAGFPQASRE